MMGKGHLIVNAAVTVSGIAAVSCGTLSEIPFINQMSYEMLDWFFPESLSLTFDNGIVNNTFVFFAGAIFAWWLGSLLPDMDSPTSTIGRIIKFPGKHRTWTHSIWAVIILIILARLHPWLRMLSLCYFLHLLADNFSAAGICWMYPFQKYREYANGAFVAPGHKAKLYYAGRLSEGVFATAITCATFAADYFCRMGFPVFWTWISI